MNSNHPDRHLHIVLAVAAVALVVGAVTGGVGFGILLGTEHVLLGVQTGALLSQTFVWGSLVFIGIGHLLYVNLIDKPEANPSQSDLYLQVDPSQVDRQVDFNEPTSTPREAAKPKRFSEVSV